MPVYLTWQWLLRVIARLDALATRMAHSKPTAPARRAPSTQYQPPEFPQRPQPRPPQRRGWLLDVAPIFAGRADQLRQLLNDPEIQALLQAAPQFKPSVRRLLCLFNIDCPAPLALNPQATPRPPPRRREHCWHPPDPKDLISPGLRIAPVKNDQNPA